jgi:hypothetical protein
MPLFTLLFPLYLCALQHPPFTDLFWLWPGAGVGAMCLTSAGRLLVGGGDGALTLLTNDHMWRDIRPFASVPGPVTSLSSTSDGSALIVGTNNGGIYK